MLCFVEIVTEILKVIFAAENLNTQLNASPL